MNPRSRLSPPAALTLVALALAALPRPAAAVCRVVEPPVDSGDPGVEFDPTTSVLYVHSPDEPVDVTCADESTPEHVGGERWVCDDGTDAEITRDDLVSLVVQPTIVALGGTAGLVMPVPARPDVAAGSPTLVRSAAALVEPMIEETVHVREDPSLGYQCTDPHYSDARPITPADVPLAMWGCSAGYYRPGTEDRETTTIDYSDAGTVETETIDTTDAYDVTVLNASNLSALRAWLDEHGFRYTRADAEAFGAYVGEDAWFVAVHVHPDESGARLALDPIVVTWRGDTFPLQHRLQYDPNGGVLTTDAWVLAPERMDAADGSGFTSYAAPADFAGTELEGFGIESGWLTHLELTQISNQWHEDSELVPVEPEVVRPTVQREVHARIAAPCCPGGGRAVTDPAAFRTHLHQRTYLESEAPEIPEEWLGSTPSPGPEWCGGETFGFGGSSSRTDLRGCAASGASLRTVAWGWAPLAGVLGVLVWRRRTRRRK